MSFAATLALIAGYDEGRPGYATAADSSLGARAALWGVNEIGFADGRLAVAGFATMPYAAYHFHRIAPYGVLANLLAMPVVSALCHARWASRRHRHAVRLRRTDVAADGLRHRVDDTVATWVASLPGAFGRVTAFGTGPLLVSDRGASW